MEKAYYNRNFYKSNLKNNDQSAVKIIKILLELIPNKVWEQNGKSVVDCGCAAGHWLRGFEKKGFDICGIDGPNIDKDLLVIPQDKYIAHDFEEPLRLDRKFSLAVSLEVAEHIHKEHADAFIDLLVDLSDIVVFSAAIPWQRGDGHVNEQWPSYWIKKFESRGYRVADCLRDKLWNDADIRYYYAQNIFLFVKDTETNAELIQKLQTENNFTQFDVVHPALWKQINGLPIMKMADILLKNKFVFKIVRKIIKK